jgi:hypothetical protein
MKLIGLILGLFGFASAFASSSLKLEVKDVWSYDTRPGEETSTVTVLKREELQGKSIVHIRIDGLKVKNPRAKSGISDSIPHMPLDENALKQSLRKKVKTTEKIPDFAEGYAEWKNAKGGFFTITLKEAVSFVEQTLSK